MKLTKLSIQIWYFGGRNIYIFWSIFTTVFDPDVKIHLWTGRTSKTIFKRYWMDQYDILECRSMAKCIGKMFIKRNCQKVNFQYWLILIWTYLVVSQSTNLYGSHPFYMNVNPETGTGFGFFWLNSNAMGKHCFKYITLFLPQARARDNVRYSQKKRSLLST